MEECYEKLKNGYDESADLSDLDTRLIAYNSQTFDVAAGERHTNAQSGQNQPWMQSQPSQPPLEMSPSHFLPWSPDRDGSGAGGEGGGQPHPQLPYPEDDKMYFDSKRLGKYKSVEIPGECVSETETEKCCCHGNGLWPHINGWTPPTIHTLMFPQCKCTT